MQTCPSCDTTLFVSGDRLEQAGSAGEMHDGPTLFTIGDLVKLGRRAWEVLGHARFSYGRGWWDEYWCEDPRGNGAWISVDEGDVVVQTAISEGTKPRFRTDARIGSIFQYAGVKYRCVEKGAGECAALRGAFGEVLQVGEVFAYANAQGEDGGLISVETSGDGPEAETRWFRGEWHDPFEIDAPPAWTAGQVLPREGTA
ncbi:DUF4178 domain-containing protein [Sagittula salina]|uniref:DUF4178 domain-containing protein n=1 Tax=Sagittula salina TaxID=2820268 RepID=A0A940MT14_9RHOB|nr:DUF4178 domain-containing protein [Sagittula salina]MBP0484133.1 DUF4178 domain-containing protein [Sagittula salina]